MHGSAEIIPCKPDADNADVGSFFLLLKQYYIRIIKRRIFLMPEKLKTIMSIAGSDPTGGAGIQCDIRAGNSVGVHVLTALTSVTVQNSRSLFSINPVPPELLERQIYSILEDVMPDAIKIGLIGSEKNMEVISAFLSSLSPETPVVVDPILLSSAGKKSMTETGMGLKEWLESYVELIFPRATVITPNLEELNMMIRGENNEKEFLKTLPERFSTGAIVLKGGHSDSPVVTDKLITPNCILEVSHPRKECRNLHGSGCAYSSLLASYLAKGYPLNEAFSAASNKIYSIIRESVYYQLGTSTYGPLNINKYETQF